MALFYRNITAFMELIQKQRELTEKVKVEQKETDIYVQNKNNFDSFAIIICMYVKIIRMDIYNHQRVYKENHRPCVRKGKREAVDIVFNFVGEILFYTKPKTTEVGRRQQTV